MWYNLAFAYASDKKYTESNEVIQNIFQEYQKEGIQPNPELLELHAKNYDNLGDLKMTIASLETSVKLHDSTDSLRKIIKKFYDTYLEDADRQGGDRAAEAQKGVNSRRFAEHQR